VPLLSSPSLTSVSLAPSSGFLNRMLHHRESDEEELLLGFVLNELAVCVHLFVFFFHFSSFYVFRVAVGWMA